MNAELLFDVLYAVGFVGIFVLLLCMGEGILICSIGFRLVSAVGGITTARVYPIGMKRGYLNE